MIIETRAFARAGLLGNPSDGYFGKTLSLIIRNFGAHISLYQSPTLQIEAREEDLNAYKSVHHLVDSVNLTGYYGGARLIKASIKKFAEYCGKEGIRLPNKNFTIAYRSSIPRQVGMAGSSAICTATMRALMAFYQVEIPQHILPSLIMSAETEELKINAGLQDRVIQVYEGCVYMDFEKSHLEQHGYGHYEPIDPVLVPKLYIAYKTSLGKVSGTVLNDIRTRYQRGDQEVIDNLRLIANLAEQGKNALLQGDHQTLHQLIDQNFDLRCKIMNVSESNREMVRVARACGASAKFTGSGGSIIGTYHDDEMLTKLVVGLKKINARVIKPIIV
jgi:glucuronokinase